MKTLLAAVGLTILALQASAISLTLTHRFGEVIDEGQVEAQVAPGAGMMQDCAAPVRAEFPRPFEVLLVSGKVPQQPFTCAEAGRIKLGPLAAGTWTFVVEYYDREGVAPSERFVSSQRVYRKGPRLQPVPRPHFGVGHAPDHERPGSRSQPR